MSLFPNADSQTCDLLRRAMHAANEKDGPGCFPLEAELVAEIIFLRRLNVETAACVRVLANMQLGERDSDDLLARHALNHAERIASDWELAPVVDALEADAEAEHVAAFECFGTAA